MEYILITHLGQHLKHKYIMFRCCLQFVTLSLPSGTTLMFDITNCYNSQHPHDRSRDIMLFTKRRLRRTIEVSAGYSVLAGIQDVSQASIMY